MAEENVIESEQNIEPTTLNNKYLTDADDSKKLFVGGLHWETTEADLKEYFTQFGNVDVAAIKVDKLSGRSRGFGFILFQDKDSVEKVLAQAEHTIRGKKIDPKQAQAPTKETKKKLFVGGVDPETSEEQLREHFSKYGTIESIELPQDKAQGKRRSYVFIIFSTESEAKAATEVVKHEINGRTCDVRIAVPPEQANRNKAWNQYQQYGGYYSTPTAAGPGYAGYGSGYSDYDYGYGYDGYGGYGQGGYYGNYGYDYYSGAAGYDASWQQPYPSGNQGYRGGATGGGGKMYSRGGASGYPPYHPYKQ